MVEKSVLNIEPQRLTGLDRNSFFLFTTLLQFHKAPLTDGLYDECVEPSETY
jgi:hypothetical protein